jgi:hypothetical protein
MQNTGQGREKKSYPVILLLVVGLAAFSSAMKELNQVRELSLQTSQLMAEWKDTIAPAGEMTPVKVETCENSRMLVPPPPPLLDVNPLPPPPAPVRVRIARPKRMDNKESSNLRSATNLIQKRDKRSNG